LLRRITSYINKDMAMGCEGTKQFDVVRSTTSAS